MAANDPLKSGLIGYIYRWIRNAGVVALASGMWLASGHLYRDSHDVPVEATVKWLSLECVPHVNVPFLSWLPVGVTCSEMDRGSRRSLLPLAKREVMFARLSFVTEIGDAREVHARLDQLGADSAQRGDRIAVAYDPEDPRRIFGVVTALSYRKGGSLIAGGLLTLLLLGLLRRAAVWQPDVDAEIAALQRAHRTRAR